MPLPYIVELTSKSSGKIEGSGRIYGRDKVIIAYSFSHKVTIPKDNDEIDHGGLNFHYPLTICKEIDKSSPVLFQHLVSASVFENVVIRFFKADGSGKDINHYTIKLNDAIITDISPNMEKAFLKENEPFRHMEYVSFAYRKIAWLDEINARETADYSRLENDPEEEKKILAGPVKEKTLKDLEIIYVDEETMEVVPGINSKFTFPQGQFQNCVSTKGGISQLNQVEDGNYQISGFEEKPEDASRKNTYALAKITESDSAAINKLKPAGQDESKPRHYSDFKHVCKLKKHRVKNGELFSETAEKYGFTFEDLAFFNWGTKDKEEILEQEKIWLECSELADSGNEYILKSGIIYIPEPYEKKNLKPGKKYIAYLKRTDTQIYKAYIETIEKNPVPNVEAELLINGGSKFKTKSDKDGLLVFRDVPSDFEGEIKYIDAKDAAEKSYAANIKAALDKDDHEWLAGLLQANVDYNKVKDAYMENYEEDLVKKLEESFTSEDDKNTITYLLLNLDLEASDNAKFIRSRKS